MSVASGAIAVTSTTVPSTDADGAAGPGWRSRGARRWDGRRHAGSRLVSWSWSATWHVLHATAIVGVEEVTLVTCTGRASLTHARARPTVEGMDNRAEVREFLTHATGKARRPRDVGLPDVGQRRVPGLRRGEVAALAGVSIEYYSRLERGVLGGVSASVLDAIARALQPRRRRAQPPVPPRPGGRRAPAACCARAAAAALVDPAPTPVVGAGRITGGRRSSATAGWTCWPPTRSGGPCTPRSTSARRAGPELRPLHLPRRGARRFYPDWDTAADTCVAILRTEAGRDPHDRLMHDLVGELSTRSDEFRRRWSQPRRPPARRRHQDLPPRRRRRARAGLRERRHGLRPRPDPHHLRRRAGLPTAEALALLGSLTATPEATETESRNA